MAGGQLIEQLARALARSSERQSGGAGLRNAIGGLRRADPAPLSAAEWTQAPFGRFEDTQLYRGMRRPLEGDAFSRPVTKWDGIWMAEDPALAAHYAANLDGVLNEGAAIYPLRVRGNMIDPETYTTIRRQSSDLDDLRRRLAELNAVGMRDPNTRTWMVLDPENITFEYS